MLAGGTYVALPLAETGFANPFKPDFAQLLRVIAAQAITSLILVPVAIFVFKDKISWVNIAGILVCLAGLVMLNWKR